MGVQIPQGKGKFLWVASPLKGIVNHSLLQCTQQKN